MSSDTITALSGTILALLVNRADFSLRTYNEPLKQFVGSTGRTNGKNRLDFERTSPREKSGPPYRIRDVTF